MLAFILACYGLTSILIHGKIFDKIRPKHHFFHCPMCVGFWVGFLLSILCPSISLFTFEFSFGNIFVLSCVSSGTSYVLDKLFGDEGVNVKWMK